MCINLNTLLLNEFSRNGVIIDNILFKNIKKVKYNQKNSYLTLILKNKTKHTILVNSIDLKLDNSPCSVCSVCKK